VERQSASDLDVELPGGVPQAVPDDVLVYRVEGPLFYGAMETFERVLSDTSGDPRVLVIRLRHMPFIDATGLRTLENVIDDLRRRGVTVMLCEANARVRGKLGRMGLIGKVGASNVVDTLAQALGQAGAGTAQA